MEYHHLSKEAVFKELKSSERGLTSKEAKKRLEKYGKNIIKKTHSLKPIKILFEQFKSFLIYILLIATIISFFVGNMVDAIVILAIVIINAGIGFFQQYRAEKAIVSLRKLLVQTSKVIREGKHMEIPSQEIVPGDILILESGDKINADSRIIGLENLQTNEAALTGESFPITKSLKILTKNTGLSKQENMLFMGTQVVRGTAKALVVETGMKTSFGKIAESLQEIEVQKTPMQKRLDVFSKQVGFVILGLVVFVFILGILKDDGVLEMFMVAVTLAVGAIPEGLPAVLAIGFAIGSKLMSKNKVIIRRLPAVESLGSVTVICTDKTGTLTEEKMKVQKIFVNNNFYSKKEKEVFLNNKKIDVKRSRELSQLIQTSILCNNARFEFTDENQKKYTIFGDPTEAALIEASLNLGFNKKRLIEKEPSVKKFEFDSKRKMMSVIRNAKKGHTMYSKGAPEKIISLSDFELVNGKQEKLTEERKKELLEKSKELEEQAYRVLGFAYKEKVDKEAKEDELVFLGFIGMIDPPRPEVKNAIKLCKQAGIDIKIITGDSAVTAKAIAKQIGIEGRIITETELNKITDIVLLKEIHEIAIFARTTPHQKLRITKILQQKKEIVAMTGDGVNDVLALKASDVGVAMGVRGTDVSRDVSDIVLVDDNFASIVEGVKQGRRTYDNIKKFTKYMLSVNFSTILLVSILIVFGFPLPIIPLQILWKNIITDSFPAMTLVFEKEEKVMKSKPRKEKSILSGIWGFIIFGGITNFFACLIVFLVGYFQSLDITLIRTMVVTTGIIFELLFVYTCRSKKPLKEIGIFSNKWLNYAILLGIGLHIGLLYTPLAPFFKVVPLTLSNWLLVIPLGVSGVLISELWKMFRKKKR